jgi:hypothetical protein
MTVAFAPFGGGNSGPMQAGTILALVEAGIEPDLLVGTSVGALNAAFLSTRPGIEDTRTPSGSFFRVATREERSASRCSPCSSAPSLCGTTWFLPALTRFDSTVGRVSPDRTGSHPARGHHHRCADR